MTPSPAPRSCRSVRSAPWATTWLLHIISILIGFSLCAVLLYLKLVEHLDDSAFEQLQTEITSVRALLHSPNGIKVIEEVMRAEGRGEEKHQSPILMRIVDREGKGVAASRMGFLPSAVFPPAGDTRIKKFSAGNTNYLLRNARLTDPLSQAHGWRLEIAMDLSEHDHLAAGYRSYLFFFAFGAFLFAIPSSYVVARRALKPLNDLSGSIRCITHSRLNTGNRCRQPVPRQPVPGLEKSPLSGIFTKASVVGIAG